MNHDLTAYGRCVPARHAPPAFEVLRLSLSLL